MNEKERKKKIKIIKKKKKTKRKEEENKEKKGAFGLELVLKISDTVCMRVSMGDPFDS